MKNNNKKSAFTLKNHIYMMKFLCKHTPFMVFGYTFFDVMANLPWALSNVVLLKYIIEAILDEKVGIQNDRITFNREKIVKELPYELTKRDKRYIEDYIVKAIQSYRNNLERGGTNDLDL